MVDLDVHVRVCPRLLLRLQAGQEEEGNKINITGFMLYYKYILIIYSV